MAFAYWTDGFGEVDQRPIYAGEVVSGFLFYALELHSSAVAFGSTGDILALGQTTVVPLPGAIWLFSSGFMLLAGRGLRRRSSRIC